MDKDFEMQGEKPGPVVVQRPNIPNDYGREKLADLLDGEWLKEAQEWYTLYKAAQQPDKKAFAMAIYDSKFIIDGKKAAPKPRAFTADELKAAIQFFTGAQIPIEHIEMWGRGIDPYLVEGENPADQDEF